ncbi:MAG: SGNH/GDSL hydrolase family protein [Anaerolineales bacterium]|nr:SGNH/GDSL hydrolase family protein [Anaerolineales bacterium]
MSQIKQSPIIGAVILVTSTVLALCLAEALVRIKNSSMSNYDIEMWRYARELKVPSTNPVLGHEHKKGSSAVLQSVKIRINDLGLRGDEISQKQQGKRRILFLGSSVTLGWGVNEEETMTENLTQIFQNNGQGVEILNAGIGNYNTVRYVERYLDHLVTVEPSDIAIHFFPNDTEVLSAGGGNILLRHSQLAVTLWSASNQLRAAINTPNMLHHYQELYREDSHGFQAMRDSLAILANHATHNNIRLYLIMCPDIQSLEDYRYTFVHETMKTLAAELGYEYLDLLPSLQGFAPEQIWVMPGDPHPNAFAHKLMAESIYPWISEIE